jgi:hypothetical protein
VAFQEALEVGRPTEQVLALLSEAIVRFDRQYDWRSEQNALACVPTAANKAFETRRPDVHRGDKLFVPDSLSAKKGAR